MSQLIVAKKKDHKLEQTKDYSKEEAKRTSSDKSSEVSPIEQKLSRKKPTAEDHIHHYDDLLTYLNSEIDRKSRNMEAGIRTLRKARKQIMAMRKELPKIRFTKKSFAPATKRTPTGIITPLPISVELAEFLQVPSDTLVSRLDANRAVCVYCNLKEDEKREEILRWSYLNTEHRNLQDTTDRRYILPDEKLSTLLDYDSYKKSVENGEVYRTKKNKETGLYAVEKVVSSRLSYLTVPKLLSVHFWMDDED